MKGVITGKGASLSHLNSLLLSEKFSDVDTKILARGTPGFSGADLQNMVK
jgi:ATP-dependent Zn protease